MQPDYGGGQIDGYFTHLDSVADEPSPSTVSSEWTLVLIFLFLSLLVVTVVVRMVTLPDAPTDEG